VEEDKDGLSGGRVILCFKVSMTKVASRNDRKFMQLERMVLIDLKYFLICLKKEVNVQMSEQLKIYIKYFWLFALSCIAFVEFYLLSAVSQFLGVGLLLLPGVMISFPICIFLLWNHSLKTVDKTTGKYITLIISYLIYIILMIRLDQILPWTEEGNVKSLISVWARALKNNF
jgi:hypothetical protein